MFSRKSRRAFLRNAASGGALLGYAGHLPVLSLASAASGEQARRRAVVSLHADIEPLVCLLEETPREKLIETVAARIREGLGYRDLLAALLLAGVRNVEPRPSVGFKFHAVLVVQSVHLASVAAPKKDRWLPIFWALDYFKDSQARDERERGWTMSPVNEAIVPDASRARKALIDAMERWDEPAADAAVAGLARTANPVEIWEMLFRYGARDYRSIGHKAIDVANSHRVLGVIGWKHAEPILRSLAYALLMHEDGNPADRDEPADRPWRRNQDLAKRIPPDWQKGKSSDKATLEFLATIRNGTEDDAADKVVELLTRGFGPQSIWDALFLAAGELVIRQPGIIALHSVTTTNALHYAFRNAREDFTRRLIVLQNAAFLPMFRASMSGRGRIRKFAIDTMKPLATEATDAGAAEEIFADVGRDSMAAACKTLSHVRSGGPLGPWTETARQLLIRKGSGAHDFKFGCAVLEDSEHVSPTWRSLYLASAVFHLQGSDKRDNPLVVRTRRALHG